MDDTTKPVVIADRHFLVEPWDVMAYGFVCPRCGRRQTTTKLGDTFCTCGLGLTVESREE